MTVIYLLLPLSILLAGGFLWAFFWAVRNGQFDDTCTPSMRVLLEEPNSKPGDRLKSKPKLKPKN